MGQTLPTIAVKRFTGAEQEQIKQTYSVLCQRSGTTKINQPTFVQYWNDYLDPIIADRLWLIFDTKYDSFLDFEEWCTCLSNTLRGNKDDRFNLIKSIFDIDDHGYVTEANVRKLFATNLFAARNIIKPFDWEAYETAKKNADSESANEYVKALYGFTGTNDMELTFAEGTVMQLLQRVDSDWWWCDHEDRQGYVPANYVELVKTPVKSTKLSKFQTVKRGMELEVLMYSLMRRADQGLGGKIPRDSFMEWAREHEMDMCFNALEKFDLRANKPTTVQTVEVKAPPLPSTAHSPAPTPVVAQAAVNPAPVPKAPAANPNAAAAAANESEVPAAALRPDLPEEVSRISPELATVLRAAGIADKELDDGAMSEFVNWFIDKHAPKVGKGATVAGRRKIKSTKQDDTLHRRPLPAPNATAAASGEAEIPAAPAPPTIVVSPSSDSIGSNNTRISLHDQIKAGKKLRAAHKKTNLATLSKKDLTGLGLLLRVQIDSRRNFMAMSDDDQSSSDDEFD
jgi:Ca2+-binding EF-hand superfamily protein